MDRNSPLPPRPLMGSPLPRRGPDAEADRLLGLLNDVRADALAGRADLGTLATVRFEVYRQASLRLEDRWRMARVADLEEITAEVALQRDDLHGAWVSWRSGWWIRRLLAEDAPDAWAHADTVMAILHTASGRGP